MEYLFTLIKIRKLISYLIGFFLYWPLFFMNIFLIYFYLYWYGFIICLIYLMVVYYLYTRNKIDIWDVAKYLVVLLFFVCCFCMMDGFHFWLFLIVVLIMRRLEKFY